jgi:Uri superfamily endonuclease
MVLLWFSILEMSLDLFLGKGIYTLLLELKHKREIKIGSLGPRRFFAGYYAYTGSARGPGGFSRVRRHLDVSAGSNPARRWHVDYLLPYTHPKTVILTYTDMDLECIIAQAIGSQTETISGFGCSDCRCDGHLHMEKDINKLITIVIVAHNQVAGITQKLNLCSL